MTGLVITPFVGRSVRMPAADALESIVQLRCAIERMRVGAGTPADWAALVDGVNIVDTASLTQFGWVSRDDMRGIADVVGPALNLARDCGGYSAGRIALSAGAVDALHAVVDAWAALLAERSARELTRLTMATDQRFRRLCETAARRGARVRVS